MSNVEAFQQLAGAAEQGLVRTRGEIIAGSLPQEVVTALAIGAVPRIENGAFVHEAAPLSEERLGELVAYGLSRHIASKPEIAGDTPDRPVRIWAGLTMRAFQALPGQAISLERPDASVVLHSRLSFRTTNVPSMPDMSDETNTICWFRPDDPAALDKWTEDSRAYRATDSAHVERREAVLDETEQDPPPEDYARLSVPEPAHRRLPKPVAPDIDVVYLHRADTLMDPHAPRAQVIDAIKEQLGDAAVMIRPIPVGQIGEDEIPKAINWLLDSGK